MDRIHIEGKDHTPTIDLDPRKALLSFQGESFPENPFAVFKPVIEWIRQYFAQVGPETETILDIRLRYLNSSSTKIFMMIFDLCADAVARGNQVKIRWKYEKDNDLVKELGEDLGCDLVVPFEILEEE
jgi:hypothetical protein